VKRFGLVETSSVPAPEYYMYSSYQNFLKTRTDDWVDTDWVENKMRELIPGTSDYKSFVEDSYKWRLPNLGKYQLE
jgi:hypothetical protein